jgi:hypothetical protein
MQEQGKSISELAGNVGVSPSYFTRVLRLSFLAPEIVRAILSGRQPPHLTAKHLMSPSRLPKHGQAKRPSSASAETSACPNE